MSYFRGKDKLKFCGSCGWFVVEIECCSCENKEMVVVLDEDVCDWLEEDLISDLELFFVVEEVESIIY